MLRRSGVGALRLSDLWAVLGGWGVGMLGCWGVGVLGCWGVGVLGCWDVAALRLSELWAVLNVLAKCVNLTRIRNISY